MKIILKSFRQFIANIFLQIGHDLDTRDQYDLEAELKRLDPSYQKCSDNVK